jgi:L-lysine 2,3-aminomutase
VQLLLHAGVPVRNQTVLLRGINDCSATLVDLMNGLVGIGVMPYYLFQCRPVIGVKNRFQVTLQEGARIVEEAQSNLNGLAKGVRFMMSHETSKIEILGCMDDAADEGSAASMLFKYHQARDRSNLGKLFTVALPADACWL